MAEKSASADKQMKAHMGTYSGFLTLSKWAIGIITLTLVLLAAFVA